MASDPMLAGMLADIADAMPEAGDSVTITVGTESCAALYDDGELVEVDTSGRGFQTQDTVVRYDGNLMTRPAVNASLLVTWATADVVPLTFTVRSAAKDPQNPGLIRVVLSRS